MAKISHKFLTHLSPRPFRVLRQIYYRTTGIELISLKCTRVDELRVGCRCSQASPNFRKSLRRVTKIFNKHTHTDGKKVGQCSQSRNGEMTLSSNLARYLLIIPQSALTLRTADCGYIVTKRGTCMLKIYKVQG